MKVFESVDVNIIAKNTTNQVSLAVQRLQMVLAGWERDKVSHNYHWLYVCARHQGEKLCAIWLGSRENGFSHIEHEMAPTLAKATSFEVEILHSPEVRDLNPMAKNQWNSLRGKQAMEIQFGGKTTRWAATEMIARNLGFGQALNRHLVDIQYKLAPQATIPVTLYQAKQWFCDNSPASNKNATAIEMFRGNRVVDIETINSGSVLRCAQGMTRWLAAQVDESGAANYKYWPSCGAYASSNNAIRQWMATVCLGRAARSFGSEPLATIAAKNLAYNLSTTYQTDGKQNYIWMNGSAKLGSAALAALAILESPQRKHYLNEEYALHSMIYSLGNADGSFDTFYIPRERKDNQNFYSGEALLFLATRYSISRNPEDLKRIMAAFHYYRTWHLQNRNPAFVPWHTQAYFLVWKITKDEALKDFIFEMNDWLLSMQQWESAEFTDMQGRFYDPARPYFGPPHASSTGVYLEGLIDAFAIAKELGDQQRAENYRIAIVRGIRSLMQLQYKGAVDCFYIKNVNRVLGGVRTTVYDNTIRIDNVQHGLMALLKIINRFSVRDYQLDDSKNQVAVQTSQLVSSSARVQKGERLGIWLREEVFNACATIAAYNDHAWAAKSVAARNTRPEMGSLFFAKQAASEELKLLRVKTSQPSAIFAEREVAKILSSEFPIPIYEVANLLETARSLADASRLRTTAKIIGITGSVGKTSVKDALSQVLAAQGITHATQANANDGWGVLDTLMNLPLDARYAVMELGMLGVGSIRIKSERIKPHVGIITNIHDSHLSFHGDESSIAHTKSGLIDGLVPDGLAILPRDSSWYDFLKIKASRVGVNRIITFGKHPEADFRLVKTAVQCGNNIIHACLLGKPVTFQIGASGDHWGLNTMAILAAVYAVGADVDAAISAMAAIKPSFRRGEVHRVNTDTKRYTVIDDTWNASPASVVAALKNMASIEVKEDAERILFIGDMLQLGKNERQKHVELVDVIVASGVAKVFSVGEISESLFQALPPEFRGQHLPDATTASIVAKEIVDNGDVVLIKGSNAIEMWRVVRALREVSTPTDIAAAHPARTRRAGVVI
ncbi:MAG: hypothetical protein H7A08_03810 [Oceanospirillaceae bacterium]|nr:hypothetical protein [Oceanospirillaceae bacterium]